MGDFESPTCGRPQPPMRGGIVGDHTLKGRGWVGVEARLDPYIKVGGWVRMVLPAVGVLCG